MITTNDTQVSLDVDELRNLLYCMERALGQVETGDLTEERGVANAVWDKIGGRPEATTWWRFWMLSHDVSLRESSYEHYEWWGDGPWPEYEGPNNPRILFMDEDAQATVDGQGPLYSIALWTLDRDEGRRQIAEISERYIPTRGRHTFEVLRTDDGYYLLRDENGQTVTKHDTSYVVPTFS